MRLNDLYPFPEERKSRKRVGRGAGSGRPAAPSLPRPARPPSPPARPPYRQHMVLPQ